MGRLPELPAEAVAEYWQLVRDALLAGGMPKSEATTAIKTYRAWMKPAGWTIYNDDPKDTAEAAKDYAAWMREEQEQAASKANDTKRAIERPTHAVGLPSQHEISRLPTWAQVSLAVRCAQRVLPQLLCPSVKGGAAELVDQLKDGLAVATESVATARSLIERSVPLSIIAGRVASNPFAGEQFRLANRSQNVLTSAMSSVAVIGEGDYPVSRYPTEAVQQTATSGVGEGILRRDFQLLRAFSKRLGLSTASPVPVAVFGPLWPEGPPANWPELPKPTKLKVTVQVPDGLDDAAVRSKLQKLTAALARLNVAGGGHGLKLIPPVEFTHEQDKGRADVVREEAEKPQGRGNARRGR